MKTKLLLLLGVILVLSGCSKYENINLKCDKGGWTYGIYKYDTGYYFKGTCSFLPTNPTNE